MFGYRKIKKQLKRRKEQLEKKLKDDMEAAKESGSVSDIAAGELSAYDNHPAESATQLYEREKDMAFDKLLREELGEINEALNKMEQGTYGIDEKTGEKISRARLKAMPTAKTSVANVPPRHGNKIRPVEESVLIESEESGTTDFQADGFDEQNAFDLVSRYNDQPMIFEDAPYSDDEEGIGFVEDIEAFAANGLNGYEGDDTIRILRNQHDRRQAEQIDEIDPNEQ